MLGKINDGIEKICLNVGFVLLSVFIVVVLLKVIIRNYFHVPMMWADEVAVICFIWTVFLGAAVAVRHKMHYTVDLAPNRFKLNLVLDLVAQVIVLSFIYVMVFHGYSFTMMGLSRFSTVLTIPLAYTFAAIPVSGLCMFLFIIERTTSDIKALRLLRSQGVNKG